MVISFCSAIFLGTKRQWSHLPSCSRTYKKLDLIIFQTRKPSIFKQEWMFLSQEMRKRLFWRHVHHHRLWPCMTALIPSLPNFISTPPPLYQCYWVFSFPFHLFLLRLWGFSMSHPPNCSIMVRALSGLLRWHVKTWKLVKKFFLLLFLHHQTCEW